MTFNPNLPTEHTLADAAQMRDQLNALKALIDAQQAQITEMSSTVLDLQDTVSTLQTRCP